MDDWAGQGPRRPWVLLFLVDIKLELKHNLCVDLKLELRRAGHALLVSIRKGSGLLSGAPGFVPDNITVVIGVNNTVTWTKNDTVAHTVTSTSVPSGAAAFNSGNMAVGTTFTYTFTVPGTYQYTCSYHPWMTGTITVVQG